MTFTLDDLEVQGQGRNPLIWNIFKMVTDTRLDTRKDFFESSRGLSIGTVRFDLEGSKPKSLFLMWNMWRT